MPNSLGARWSETSKGRRAPRWQYILYPLINKHSKISRSIIIRLARAYIRPILTCRSGLVWSHHRHESAKTANHTTQVAADSTGQTLLYTRIRDLHQEGQVQHPGYAIMRVTEKLSMKKKRTAKTPSHIRSLGDFSSETVLPYQTAHTQAPYIPERCLTPSPFSPQRTYY